MVCYCYFYCFLYSRCVFILYVFYLAAMCTLFLFRSYVTALDVACFMGCLSSCPPVQCELIGKPMINEASW